MFNDLNLRIFIALLWAFALSTTTIAETHLDISFPPRLEDMPVIEGEPQQIVSYAIMEQDNRGHLCIAGRIRGVFCYDGIDLITVYEQSAVGLVALQLDNEKILHFATREKILSLQDGKTKVLFSGADFPLDNNEKILSLFQTNDDSYLISTNLKIYEYQKGKILELPLTRVRRPFWVSVTDKTEYLVGRFDGLYRLNKNGDILEHKFPGIEVYYHLDNYTLTNQGVFHLDKKVHEGFFYRAFRRKNGELLFLGNLGVCLLKPSGIHCPVDSQYTAYTLYEDDFENLWVSTNVGIKLNKKSLVSFITTENGLNKNNVYALAKHDREIYIGTTLGVNKFDLNQQEMSLVEGTESLRVRSLFVTQSGLWIGTLNSGLFLYDFERGLRAIQSVPIGAMFSIHALEDKVWVAIQFDGIYALNASGDLIWRRNQEFLGAISHMKSCHKKMYIATRESGLITMNANGQIENFTPPNKYSSFDCSEKNLNIGTSDGKLVNINQSLNVVWETSIYKPIYSVLETQNALWTVHHDGLGRWTKGELEKFIPVHPFSKYVNTHLFIDNWLLVGGREGVGIINMNAASDFERQAPKIVAYKQYINEVLTIKPRLNNLAAMQNYHLFYQRDTQTHKNRLRNGQDLIFFPESEKIQLKLSGHNHYGQNLSNLEVDFDFFQQKMMVGNGFLGTVMHIFSYSVEIKWFFLVLLAIILYKTIQIHKRNFGGSAIEELDEALPLKNYGMFLEKQKIVLSGADVNAKRIQAFNRVIEKSDDCLPTKSAFDELEFGEQKLRHAIRKIFGSGSIKDYTLMYTRFINERKTL